MKYIKKRLPRCKIANCCKCKNDRVESLIKQVNGENVCLICLTKI